MHSGNDGGVCNEPMVDLVKVCKSGGVCLGMWISSCWRHWWIVILEFVFRDFMMMWQRRCWMLLGMDWSRLMNSLQKDIKCESSLVVIFGICVVGGFRDSRIDSFEFKARYFKCTVVQADAVCCGYAIGQSTSCGACAMRALPFWSDSILRDSVRGSRQD